ncbi:elongation of very long chain fatty acids protein 6-like [Coccinella septempunctata]|uniref:elongation of very long chain fatty acids protein 6-like n=1 Tax=Coccinella septempunctata TaxID=41139 RepID=UPI001D088032|nr:elongation of very long chain fatty acids protein 6-like [Coccinella septempunctata]
MSLINSFFFKFERQFDNELAKTWLSEQWNYSIFYVGVYLFVIFELKHLMENRDRLNIDKFLAAWNTTLAAFSIIGTFRTFPELFRTLTETGFYESICDSSYVATNRVTGTWMFLFVLSKFMELGDTIFLVLKKRPLTFLHVYHHIVGLLYTWYSYIEFSSTTRWFSVMNFIVHSIMYTYFALSAMKYKPPKQFAMMLTGLQIIQMIIGCIINLTIYGFFIRNIDCQVTMCNVILSSIMYASFLFMFSKFFMNAYIRKAMKRKAV